ncbi:MAG: SurA N-terminal domain-containing protein [Treponema sp.]|jgi:hypothetical protein|nr:SurA N-terminal domain-containing protein [Treponema sp.]
MFMDSKGKKKPIQRDGAAQSEFVRKFKTNPFVFIGTIVILIIVIVAFVLVPAIVPQAGLGDTDLTFGYYNKIPINYVPGNYFAQIQESIARYMQSSLDASNAQYIYYQVWRGAFDETVVHTGIMDEMKRAGYTAPADLVDRRVAALPQFLENGRFSSALYRQMDNTARMTLWREVQDSIAEEHYKSDMSGLRVSSKEVSFIAAMASPERRFEMVSFPLSGYPDSEIIAYVNANPDSFRQVHLSSVTITSGEREARQVRTSVEDGTLSFEDAAKNQSRDGYAEKGGDMGLRLAYELSTEIPDAAEREGVLGLSTTGALSPLVKVPAGWAFYRCEAPPVPVDTSDQTTLSKIRYYMNDFERGRIEDWLIGEAEQFIALVQSEQGRIEDRLREQTEELVAMESGFTVAAAERSLEVRNFGPLPLNYGGTDLFTTLGSFSVSELGYADSNENFWRIAFSTPLGSPSVPFVVGNSVLVLYPAEEKTAEEGTVESIESAYGSYWTSYNAERSIRSYFLSSPKFEDRFMDTFMRIFNPVQDE